MARRYNSNRRKKAAEQTRRDIVQAALKLHWQGITEFGPLAVEAGCSLPTLRKHFPNKEALFQGCTRTFHETMRLPDVEALAGIPDLERRLEECVSELCRVHEAMFGYAWLSARLREESPTLDAEMAGYDGLTDAIASIVAPADSPNAPFARGLLDFLTYRALRLSGGLTSDEVCDQLIETLRLLLHRRSSSPETKVRGT